jgi:hypothetical protein
MRLRFALTCLIVSGLACQAQSQSSANYILTIEGVEHEIALDQETKIKLKSGREVQIALKKRALGNFATGDLSFDYPGQYSVASTVVDTGITQHIVVTALGTVMLVQNYQDGLPAGLLDLMYTQMVEEPKAMGLDIEKTELSRAISNKTELKGVRAKYRGGGDNVTIDIATAEVGTTGFLILTMNDESTSPDEKQMIEQFWQSVTLKNPPTP